MRSLTSFRLKLLGIILMTLDHIYSYIGIIEGINIPIWFGYLGRLAAPIFFYLMVEGFFKTRDRKKYLGRLLSFAIIMTLIDLIFELYNNIFLSLALSVILMMIMEYVKKYKKFSIRNILGTILAIFVGILSIFTEASIYGLAMTLIFYFFRNKRRNMAIVYIIFSLIFLIEASNLDTNFLNAILIWDYQWMMVFGIIPILMYNGQLGLHNKITKWMFYVFYPAHLIAIVIIKNLLPIWIYA